MNHSGPAAIEDTAKINDDRGQIVGHDLVIVVGGVRKGPLPVDVPQRPHTLDRRHQPVVDPDVSSLVGFDAGLLETQVVGVGPPAGGQQQMGSRDNSGLIIASAN